MSTKTITITDEAYNHLKSAKSEDESFTEAIIRITKKDTLSELAGILTKKEADEMRAHLKTSRAVTSGRMKKTWARFE
ncbi:antitoxin VapB family protein [Candidatus Woesearchaeota archaeon]|nr:antitoxin VapB family protein [Candidatus Woesearchaeota archaeon]